MARIRIIFNSPQQLGPAKVSELPVDADHIVVQDDQILALNGEGEVVLSTPVASIMEIDLTRLETDLRETRRASHRARMAKIRTEHPNHGKPWSPAADEELKRMWQGGSQIPDLVEHFGRGHGAIRSRLEHLGLVELTPYRQD